MYRTKSNLQNICIIFIDCLSICLCMMLSNLIRHGALLYAQNTVLSLIGIFLIAYFMLYFIVNFNQNFIQKGPFHELFDIVKLNLCMLGIATIIMYFTRLITDFSRLVFLYFFLLNSLLTLALHQLWKYFLPLFYAQAVDRRKLLLVTTSRDAQDFVDSILKLHDFTYEITGLVLTDLNLVGEQISDLPVVADSDSLISYCKTASLDEILFHISFSEDVHMKSILEKLSTMGITLHLNIELFDLNIASRKTLTRFGKYYTVTYANQFLSIRQMLLKRAIDILGSLAGMILLILITIIVGPIIKLESPGPIFFSQKRVGRNGRIFNMYKFRSMYADAEEQKKKLMEHNEMNGLMFKMENDPRITKTGKFLRKTSLDEFPQFFNVLRGDMSLVGTRPPTLDEFENYRSYHKRRLSITPGLTGLWQVSGRSKVTDFEEVVKLDISYIDNWSIGMDLKILIKTVAVVLRGKGAK